MHTFRYHFRVLDFLPRVLFLLCAILLAILSLPRSAGGQTIQENLWITNGSVQTTALSSDGSTMYLGGGFDYVGPVTGYGGLLDLTTAEADEDMPRVNGQISAAIPDGSGGWYIGGSFTEVGGIAKQRLARIKADKSVDPLFIPSPNSDVSSIVRYGDTLFVGGYFSSIKLHRDLRLFCLRWRQFHQHRWKNPALPCCV